jgi:hypothetical protein
MSHVCAHNARHAPHTTHDTRESGKWRTAADLSVGGEEEARVGPHGGHHAMLGAHHLRHPVIFDRAVAAEQVNTPHTRHTHTRHTHTTRARHTAHEGWGYTRGKRRGWRTVARWRTVCSPRPTPQSRPMESLYVPPPPTLHIQLTGTRHAPPHTTRDTRRTEGRRTGWRGGTGRHGRSSASRGRGT